MHKSTLNQADASPTRVRYGVLAFASSLSFLTYLDRVCIMRVQKDMQSDLRLTSTQMGMVFSAFAVGYLLFEVPGGWMGDRWGSRHVITRIVLWWSLFTALTGCVWYFQPGSELQGSWLGRTAAVALNSFGVLLLVRFLFGCGEAGAYPNLNRVTGIWLPFRERAFAQGLVWMSARFGGAVAPSVFGLLMGWLSWRQAFWVLGLVGAVWSAAFFLWFRDRPEEKQSCNEAERQLIREGRPHSDHEPGHSAHPPVPWRRLLLGTNTWALGLTAFFVSFPWYFYPTWQPLFFEQVHGIEFKDSEILTGLPFLCGGMGALVGGRLSDWLVQRTGSRRWGRSLIGFGSFALAGACFCAAGSVSHWRLAVGLFCLSSFINDLGIPVIWAVCTDIGGRHAGTVSGFMNGVGALGPVLGPTLLPILRVRYHWTWAGVLAFFALSWFAGAVTWLFIDASKHLVPQGESV